MDSRVMQWLPTAKVAVEYSTRLQPREKALIVTDPTTRDYPASRDLADAVYMAARYVGADVSIIEFPARSRPNEELPDIVAAAMSAADVIYLAATMASFHTQATRRALDKGARVLGIFGGDSAANTVGRGRALDLCPRSVEELEQIARVTTALAGMFAHGGTLRATTQKGTGRHLRGRRPRDPQHGRAVPRARRMEPLRPGPDGGRAELGVDAGHARRGRQHHSGTPPAHR